MLQLAKNVGAKKRFIFLFSLVFILTLFNNYLFTFNSNISSELLYRIRPEWLDNSTSQSCLLPLNIDPYDQTIVPYIKKLPSSIKCPFNHKSRFDRFYQLKDHQSFTFMKANDSIVRIMRIKGYEKAIKCFYKSFARQETNDNELIYGDEKPINGHKLDLEKLGIEFIKIRCEYNGDTVYENLHHWPTKLSSSINSSAVKQPSVVIFVVESLSYLNFKRFMHQTDAELNKFSHNYVLRGLVKLADNTFPNMIPLLVGTRPYYEKWPYSMDIKDGPFDDLPIIWKDYKRKNYTTGFVEDDPIFGLFNYLAKGFEKPPTDWYPRPVWLQIDKEQGIENIELCYRRRPKFDIWLQQVKQFINKAHKSSQPFFLFAFHILVTHNHFTRAQLIDKSIANFIKEYRHILDDTFFVFMGDHGNRFGSILETAIGRIETSMPYFSIHIPKKIASQHPHLDQYLKLNEKRLTTWLDVRHFLLDIVNSNYSKIQTSLKKSSYSVWREEVPSDRTCVQAHIPDQYCLCNQRTDIDTNSNLVKEAAYAIVTKLNHLLASFSHLCHKLELSLIKDAKQVFKPEVNDTIFLEIVLTVKPSKALLQAQVSRSLHSNSSLWQVDDDISRFDKYKDQSLCIDDKILRKYCYCI